MMSFWVCGVPAKVTRVEAKNGRKLALAFVALNLIQSAFSKAWPMISLLRKLGVVECDK